MRSCSFAPAYNIDELPHEECMKVFVRRAFRPHEKLDPVLLKIGESIVKKCRVPLAAKTLGSLLSNSRDTNEWKHVEEDKLCNVKQEKDGILPALKLSYGALLPHLRTCLVSLSTFPKDYNIIISHLIMFWMALGFLPRTEESKEAIGVRDVISPDGSPDRFLDPRRALIGGACRFVAVGPPSRSAR
jgi:hypothetical protein